MRQAAQESAQDTSKPEVAVLEAEKRRQDALVRVDLAALDELFAEDLIHIHSTGLIHTKTQLLEHIQSRRSFVAIERSSLQVRIYGSVAVMFGGITNHMRNRNGEGVILLHGIVTQILRRHAEGWKFIHFQFTLDQES